MQDLRGDECSLPQLAHFVMSSPPPIPEGVSPINRDRFSLLDYSQSVFRNSESGKNIFDAARSAVGHRLAAETVAARIEIFRR